MPQPQIFLFPKHVRLPLHTLGAPPQFHCRRIPSWPLSRSSWSRTQQRDPSNEICILVLEAKATIIHHSICLVSWSWTHTWTVVSVFLPFLCWILGTKAVNYKSASFQKVFLMPVLPIANCYQIANHLMWTTPSCPDSSSPLLASAKGSKAFRLSNWDMLSSKWISALKTTIKTIFGWLLRCQLRKRDFKMQECLIWISPSDQVVPLSGHAHLT